MIKSALNELETELKKINAPILSRLQPGINSVDFKNSLPINIPKEVLELYAWHNGTNTTGAKFGGELSLFSMGILIEAARSVNFYNRCAGIMTNWDTSHFPVFESGSGAFHVIQCDSNKEDYGAIYFHTITAEDGEVNLSVYDNLEMLVRTITQCYKEGIYKIDDMGLLSYDVARESALSLRMNPKSPGYWF